MQYEDRIVCFIDILGFKGHINQSKGNPKKIKAIADALQAIRRVLDIDSTDDADRDGAAITQFSDSIVISFRCDEMSGVMHTLIKLIWTQATLVNHGMLARGAIVRGDFIHENNIMFGQGIIDAYKAESKYAIYPRIIVDASVLHVALNFAQHHPAQEAQYLADVLQKDDDGKFFIDYFGASAQGEQDDPELDYIPYLEKIRNIINCDQSNFDANTKAKYIWLASKYNATIERISLGLESEGIDPQSMKANCPKLNWQEKLLSKILLLLKRMSGFMNH